VDPPTISIIWQFDSANGWLPSAGFEPLGFGARLRYGAHDCFPPGAGRKPPPASHIALDIALDIALKSHRSTI